MLLHNPATEATLPSHKTREKEVQNSSERARFLNAASDRFYGVFHRTLIDTGLRPGEACGPRWRDVDFERATISVQRTVTRGAGGTAVLDEPKTPKSRRSIPMFGSLRNEFLRHLDWQRERGLNEAVFVLANQYGQMLRPWTFAKRDLVRTVRLPASQLTSRCTRCGTRLRR